MDLSAICKQEEVTDMLFAITFTLLSGMFNVQRLSFNEYQEPIRFNFMYMFQAIFEDFGEYANTFSRKFAQNDFRVLAVHRV